MLGIVYRGIIIGILVSAPMGPIGLMCIQRTLYKGRWHGFVSGVGAAFSDFLYALITGLGVGFVVSFIEEKQYTLQIVGSLLLMWYGVYIFRSQPQHLRKPSHPKKQYSYSQDVVTAFLLTLSNPLIIFLFIALFARFNFINPDEKLHSLLIGLGSIFVGALLWWFVLTTLVAKLRKVFKESGLLLMNRVVGIVIILLSFFGLVLSVAGYGK
jgi:threonine/homoserine/homoserine lactone efflux protein